MKLNIFLKLKAFFFRIFLYLHGIILPIPLSNWAIGTHDVLIIIKTVRAYQQRKKIKIIEFGSGVSTFVFLSLSKYFNDFSLISFEADPTWFMAIKNGISNVHDLSGDKSYRIYNTPYVSVDDYTGYELEKLDYILRGNLYDYIFIDAPPDTICEDARLKLANYVTPLLSKYGTLVVHDVFRIEERYLFDRLKNGFLSSAYFPTKKGLGILRFPLGNKHAS